MSEDEAGISKGIPLRNRVRQNVPEGHSVESGFCLQMALFKGGYDIVDLPEWVHVDDIPIVCEELGLEYITGKGKTIYLKRGEPVIIGHIVQRGQPGEQRIGHWTFTSKPEETLQQIPAKDIFAFIRFPKGK